MFTDIHLCVCKDLSTCVIETNSFLLFLKLAIKYITNKHLSDREKKKQKTKRILSSPVQRLTFGTSRIHICTLALILPPTDANSTMPMEEFGPLNECQNRGQYK